tara:strand:+ start:6432 stop:7205 length:774 start_codon:yes stop_codon:yes gene_type:complete
MVNNNLLKQKLIKNEQTYGCWVTIAHPLIPEILAHAGFDWLAVDMEHSSLGLNELLPLIISIENNNITPIVRVGENNSNLIKRVMDAGANGVIVPNINDAQGAKKAVNSVKYPPLGKRGVGLYRAQKYGKNFNEYLEWLEKESIVIIQIENKLAVENIDKIFSVAGIDAFIIGPYDLSSSLGKPGKFDDPEVKNAIKTVINAGEKYGITSGYHSVSSDPTDAIKFKNNGFKFLGFSLDSIFLGDAAITGMHQLTGNS